MEQFRSGWKQSTTARVTSSSTGCGAKAGTLRCSAQRQDPLYGEAFWSTYTQGDNTNLIATDSMKNFVQA